jgi:hypothetical protein
MAVNPVLHQPDTLELRGHGGADLIWPMPTTSIPPTGFGRVWPAKRYVNTSIYLVAAVIGFGDGFCVAKHSLLEGRQGPLAEA